MRRWKNGKETTRLHWLYAEKRGIQQGIEQGKQSGIKIGAIQERRKIAADMLAGGLPKKKIADILKVTLEELDNILKSATK